MVFCSEQLRAHRKVCFYLDLMQDHLSQNDFIISSYLNSECDVTGGHMLSVTVWIKGPEDFLLNP